MDQSCNRSLLGQLMELVNHLSDAVGILLASLGNENHVTLHVSCRLVVLAVGDLPRKIWNKEKGMANPAGCIVKNLGCRESLVTALVCHDPETGSKQTLHDGVKSPYYGTNCCGWNVLGSNIFVAEEESDSEAGNISKDIAQASEARSLVAVFGNGISNIVHTVVRELEFVAVGVEKFAIRSATILHFLQR